MRKLLKLLNLSFLSVFLFFFSSCSDIVNRREWTLIPGVGIKNGINIGDSYSKLFSVFKDERYVRQRFGAYEIVEYPELGLSFVIKDGEIYGIRLHNPKYEAFFKSFPRIKTAKGLKVSDNIKVAKKLYGKPDVEISFPLSGIKDPKKVIFGRYKRDLIGKLVIYYQGDSGDIIRIETYEDPYNKNG